MTIISTTVGKNPLGERSSYDRKQKDVGSIPALERPLGGGHGNPLQYSCLEKLIYYSGQESLRRHGVALIVNKSVKNTEIRVQFQK